MVEVSGFGVIFLLYMFVGFVEKCYWYMVFGFWEVMFEEVFCEGIFEFFDLLWFFCFEFLLDVVECVESVFVVVVGFDLMDVLWVEFFGLVMIVEVEEILVGEVVVVVGVMLGIDCVFCVVSLMGEVIVLFFDLIWFEFGEIGCFIWFYIVLFL